MFKSIRAKALSYIIVLVFAMLAPGVVMALDRPFISVTFFYWYTWGYKKEWGGWIDGGVDNTPLYGYYDSPSYDDEYRSLWLAEEWGVTHYYLDYWGPGWKAKDNKTPRETIIFRAAEQLQKEGYDINLSYLQDGFKFNMEDFSKNISDPKNPDVKFWLDNYAQSPTWIKHNGKPFWLIYANSGSPKMTAEITGFRKYLEGKYGSIDKLNKQWGSKFANFGEIALDFSKGWNRVESINYQYIVWQNQMDEMNRLVKEKYGWPGIIPAFDVWVEPFRNFGYSNYHKTLGAPHSYGGVFGPPETQDPQRFIQSAVAKQYNTVFHDHYKNFYCDWNTESRIPGTKYFPDPYNFDRFWVGDLMRYDEAIYHLSWNEWWEGSNLEPCLEQGKKYCEKNLFYSTIMKECFDSIHNYAKGAKAAVLLNDWSWLFGGNDPADAYGVIQVLREFSVPFELLPDDFVTSEKLENFDLVIAPANKVGFGFNNKNESVSKVLQTWVEAKQGRRLIVSVCPEFISYLGLKEGRPKLKGPSKGNDLNVFLDIGEEGDDIFAVEGWSGREDWGKLPADKFGATAGKLTVRWTPADGDRWSITCPVSPNREHIVRWLGNAIWANSVKVMVDDQSITDVEILPGWNEYEAVIPADKMGGRAMATIALVYAKKNVPGVVDPNRFKDEARVCNMSMDWVQISTSNIEKGVKDKKYETPKSSLALTDGTVFGEMKGREIILPAVAHKFYEEKPGKALSVYSIDQAPRDIAVSKGKGEVLITNGPLGTLEDKPYWEKVLSNWAKVDLPKTVYGDNVRGAWLFSGGTSILLAYNYDQTKKTVVSGQLPAGTTVAEVIALRSDGNEYKPITYEVKDGKVLFSDEIQYFGVYEVVFSPIAISHKPLVLHPGEKTSIELTLKNLSDKSVSGTLKLKSVIPTLGSDVLNYSLAAKEEKRISLAIWAKDTVDWGNKTIEWELDWLTNEPKGSTPGENEPKGSTPKGSLGVGASAPLSSERAVYWRPLFVERNPDLTVLTKVIDSGNPVLTIKNQEFKPMTSKEKGFITNGTAKDIKVTIDNKTTAFGDIASNQETSKPLILETSKPSSASVERKVIRISYTQYNRQVTVEDTVSVMLYPQPKITQKEIQLFVCNAKEKELADRLFVTDLPKGLSAPFRLTAPAGESIPCQILDDKLVFVLPFILQETCVSLTILKGEKGNDQTDLTLTSSDLGTGKGTLTVANKHFSITLSEEKGGTAIAFVSAKTNVDYACSSFGVNYGKFSEHDPLVPAQNAVQFIKESKTTQSGKPGKIKVLADGLLYKKVQVSWSDENIDASQVYEFWASQKQFRVTVDITPKKDALACEEVVAFDAEFMRDKIYKIFPGGTGMKRHTGNFTKEFPHGGWRYVDYIHSYSTMISAKEQISFIVEEKSGINKYRQGIWPAERPKTGKLDFARIEYISLLKEGKREPAHLSLWVMLHAVTHKYAKEFQQELVSPLAIVSK